MERSSSPPASGAGDWKMHTIGGGYDSVTATWQGRRGRKLA